MGRKKQWPPRPHPHRASGQERVRVLGTDVYLGPIGSAEAAKNYALLLEDLEANRPAEQPVKERRAGLSVAEVLERWDQHAAKRYSKEGREAAQYRYAAEPLLSVYGLLPAARFGLPELDGARDEMLRRGWCRKVTNRRVIRLRTIWRWAEQRGLVPAGAWAALRALEPLTRGDARARESAGRGPCDWKDFALVCRNCPRTVRDMLLVCWFSGARPAEVRLMLAGEVDTTAREWVFRPGRHKNAWRGQARDIVLGPRAQKVLARHLAGKEAEQLVFPSSPLGRPYRDDSFARAVARARLRAGAVGVIPYACRHSAKRRMTRAAGLDAARAALGQASLDTTDRYAAGGDLELARKVARRLG